MSDLLIVGAALWSDPDADARVAHRPGERADVLIRDGVIAEIGNLSAPAGVPRLDADGLALLPGLVDLHTHLREPGREDAETIASGSAAAAAGGFTAILALANTDPVTDTAEAAERVHDRGREVGLADVVPVGAVTKGLAGSELAELALMARSPVPPRAVTKARSRVDSDSPGGPGLPNRSSWRVTSNSPGIPAPASTSPTCPPPNRWKSSGGPRIRGSP